MADSENIVSNEIRAVGELVEKMAADLLIENKLVNYAPSSTADKESKEIALCEISYCFQQNFEDFVSKTKDLHLTIEEEDKTSLYDAIDKFYSNNDLLKRAMNLGGQVPTESSLSLEDEVTSLEESVRKFRLSMAKVDPTVIEARLSELLMSEDNQMEVIAGRIINVMAELVAIILQIRNLWDSAQLVGRNNTGPSMEAVPMSTIEELINFQAQIPAEEFVIIFGKVSSKEIGSIFKHSKLCFILFAQTTHTVMADKEKVRCFTMFAQAINILVADKGMADKGIADVEKLRASRDSLLSFVLEVEKTHKSLLSDILEL